MNSSSRQRRRRQVLTVKMQCPRCHMVYVASGMPTKNPGGLGARDGWTCVFCADDPPAHIRVQYAAALKNPLAACWHPVYLEPYTGDAEPDFIVSQEESDA